MKLIPYTSILLLLLLTTNGFSQRIVTTLDGKIDQPKDTVSNWTKKKRDRF
jgi:hypothetical protein